MPIPWALIIETAIKLISECIEPTPESVRHPRGLQRVRFERAARDHSGMSRKEWRQNGGAYMAEVYAELNAASDEDLQYLIDQAKAA